MNDDLILIVELTNDDEVSSMFVRRGFPYALGDLLVKFDLADARAFIKIAQNVLSAEQKRYLDTTESIVNYDLKERAELKHLINNPRRTTSKRLGGGSGQLQAS